jgi:hypothetical protein
VPALVAKRKNVCLIGLVRLACDSENASDWGCFLQLRVKVFGFFVHSKPPKLADKVKNLPRWALTILVNRNLSTLQVGMHQCSPLKE